MTGDSIDYSQLVRTALRGVVRGALALTAESGLPGGHHFYISFRTGHPGVRLAPRLRERFPDEMTIVLQHRFDDLEADENGFAVTLGFDGVSERVAVPFAAVTSFADPEAEFALRFEPARETTPEDSAPDRKAPPREAPEAAGDARVVAVDFSRGARREGG